jgi:hypothetical protein
MMDTIVTRNVAGHGETTMLLIPILRNVPDHRGLTATLKAGKKGHHQHRSLTSRSPDMTVTLKEAEKTGLQRRSVSAMKKVLMVTITMHTEEDRREAPSTSRV